MTAVEEKGFAAALAWPARAGSPELARGAAELFAERELAVEAHHRVQRFFLRLDRETDFELASPPWRGAMAALAAELLQRLRFRAFHAERGRGVDFDPPRRDAIQAARDVSKVFQACAEELAGHPWKLLPYAFELFVAGRLAVAHDDPALQARLLTHGAPNSSSYFLFPELANLCLESGIDPAFWEPAFEALVRTSELLARHPAAPPDAGMPSEARARLYGHRDGHALPMADVRLARAAYAAALAPPVSDEERRRLLCDSLGLIAAGACLHAFTSVWWTPGRTRPLTVGAPIGKALLDARSAPA